VVIDIGETNQLAIATSGDGLFDIFESHIVEAPEEPSVLQLKHQGGPEASRAPILLVCKNIEMSFMILGSFTSFQTLNKFSAAVVLVEVFCILCSDEIFAFLYVFN